MRKISPILFVLLFTLLTIAGCKTSYTHDTDESLAQSFFKIVQKKDRAGLNTLMPTMEDMLYVLSVSGVPEEAGEMMRKKIEDKEDPIWQELQLNMDSHWENLYKDMEAAGFNPRKATFTGSSIHLAKEKGNDFTTADIDVLMVQADSLYRIEIKKAGKVPRGWLIGGDGFKWKGSSQD